MRQTRVTKATNYCFILNYKHNKYIIYEINNIKHKRKFFAVNMLIVEAE